MDELTQAEQEFIERFGLAAEADRLPRIAGKIMALLLLDGGPLGFDAITERLQVSRGSVSTDCRLLESLGIIERVTLPGDRRDYFRITDVPGRRLLEGAVERLRKTREIVADMRRQLDGRGAEAVARFARMEAFYDATVKGIRGALAELAGRS